MMDVNQNAAPIVFKKRLKIRTVYHSVWIPNEAYSRMRALHAETGLTMKALLTQAVEEFLARVIIE